MRSGICGLLGALIGFLLGAVGGFAYEQIKMPDGATAGDGCVAICENIMITGGGTVVGFFAGLFYPSVSGYRASHQKQEHIAETEVDPENTWSPSPRKPDEPDSITSVAGDASRP